MSGTVPLPQPDSVETHYSIPFDESPIVDTLEWGDRIQMRVTDVLVTEFPFPFGQNEPFARATGYAVKANGEKDSRFNRLVPAPLEIDAAYLAAHLSWTRARKLAETP